MVGQMVKLRHTLLALYFFSLFASWYEYPQLGRWHAFDGLIFVIPTSFFLILSLTMWISDKIELAFWEKPVLIGYIFSTGFALMAYKNAYRLIDKGHQEFQDEPFYCLMKISFISFILPSVIWFLIWPLILFVIREAPEYYERLKTFFIPIKSQNQFTNVPFEDFTILEIDDSNHIKKKDESLEPRIKLVSENSSDTVLLDIDGQAFTLLYFLAKETEQKPNFSDRKQNPWLLKPWEHFEVLSRAYSLINVDLEDYILRVQARYKEEYDKITNGFEDSDFRKKEVIFYRNHIDKWPYQLRNSSRKRHVCEINKFTYSLFKVRSAKLIKHLKQFHGRGGIYTLAEHITSIKFIQDEE